jgi:hypothetical protein
MGRITVGIPRIDVIKPLPVSFSRNVCSLIILASCRDLPDFSAESQEVVSAFTSTDTTLSRSSVQQ